MALLTNEDKERCRYHLGYMATGQAAASLVAGIPRPAQTMFLIEQAFALLTNEYALARVRRILTNLDQIEEKIFTPGVELLYAESIGEMKLRGATPGQTSTDLIENEYRRWAMRLADCLGVPLYPYSQRFKSRGPGNIHVRNG